METPSTDMCGNAFFIDAPGGTGKSFLLNLILKTARSKGKVALAVASSGIAATVLQGGRTAHNMFKIPLMESYEIKSCSIKKNTNLAKLLTICSIIVWDEVVMANKNLLLGVDMTMRDILENEQQFMGGVTFVCAGDFRQILPVVKRGGKNKELDATIKNAYFWPSITKLELTENIRLRPKLGVDNVTIEKNKTFAETLLQMGSSPDRKFNPPTDFGIIHYNEDEFIETIYPDLENHMGDLKYFAGRCIIAPLNTDVDNINTNILNRIPGEPKTYYSIDSLEDEESYADYQVSTLNALSPSSLPPHELVVKKGSILMIIRNLSPPRICNGTRIIVDNLKNHVIVGRILFGVYEGEQVIIPRISLRTNDSPIQFMRIQFPVKVSFAMTINKSQGQTINMCGLYLKNSSCFSHGQLYVACSRVTSWDSLHVLVPCQKDTIKNNRILMNNVVYSEIFDSELTIDQERQLLSTKDKIIINDDSETYDPELEIKYTGEEYDTDEKVMAQFDSGMEVVITPQCVSNLEDAVEKIDDAVEKIDEKINENSQKIDEKLNEICHELKELNNKLTRMEQLMQNIINKPPLEDSHKRLKLSV